MVNCGANNQALLAAGTLLWMLLKTDSQSQCTPYWRNGRLVVADTEAGPIYIDSTPDEELNMIAKCSPACPNTVSHGDKRNCCRYSDN